MLLHAVMMTPVARILFVVALMFHSFVHANDLGPTFQRPVGELEIQPAPQVQNTITEPDSFDLLIKLKSGILYNFDTSTYETAYLEQVSKLTDAERVIFRSKRDRILRSVTRALSVAEFVPGVLHMTEKLIYRYLAPNHTPHLQEQGHLWIERTLRNIDQSLFISSKTVVSAKEFGVFFGGNITGGPMFRRTGINGSASLIGTLGINLEAEVATLSFAAIPERTIEAAHLAPPIGGGAVFGFFAKDPKAHLQIAKGQVLSLPGPFGIAAYNDSLLFNVNMSPMDWIFMTQTKAEKISSPTLSIPLPIEAFSAFYKKWKTKVISFSQPHVAQVKYYLAKRRASSEMVSIFPSRHYSLRNQCGGIFSGK
ncbi:MAG: hypothetical protein AB7F59_08680 [Bdellovibrionales bacterium]